MAPVSKNVEGDSKQVIANNNRCAICLQSTTFLSPPQLGDGDNALT